MELKDVGENTKCDDVSVLADRLHEHGGHTAHPVLCLDGFALHRGMRKEPDEAKLERLALFFSELQGRRLPLRELEIMMQNAMYANVSPAARCLSSDALGPDVATDPVQWFQQIHTIFTHGSHMKDNAAGPRLGWAL